MLFINSLSATCIDQTWCIDWLLKQIFTFAFIRFDWFSTHQQDFISRLPRVSKMRADFGNNLATFSDRPTYLLRAESIIWQAWQSNSSCLFEGNVIYEPRCKCPRFKRARISTERLPQVKLLAGIATVLSGVMLWSKIFINNTFVIIWGKQNSCIFFNLKLLIWTFNRIIISSFITLISVFSFSYFIYSFSRIFYCLLVAYCKLSRSFVNSLIISPFTLKEIYHVLPWNSIESFWRGVRSQCPNLLWLSRQYDFN